MENTVNAEEFERFPLRLAYGFLAKKGFESEANEIKHSRDSYKSYTSSLRRGKLIELLEKNNLLEEFIGECWPLGRTKKGDQHIQRYKRIYSAFLNSDRSEDEEEEERIEATSFAYEEDLRDYLSNNLSVIEPRLELFSDENGVKGIEYPIDAANKKVDILAIDKSKTPVVIELKVSRGYEKVIGQCLYYRNRVKQLLNSARVRIIIIAREITPQLKIAIEDLPDVELFEYNLSVKLDKTS